MVEVDPVQFISLLVVPVGIAIFLGWFKKVSKTADGTLSGTIKLEHVQSDMSGIKLEMSKGFDRMEEFARERDRKHDESMSKMWTKMSEIDSSVKLNNYRIESLERERIRYYRDDKKSGDNQ